MGCNCKNNGGPMKNGQDNKEKNKTNDTLFNKVVTYSLKFLGFLFLVSLLPIINLVIIWFIFRTLVLTKEVDIRPMISFIGRKFKDTNVEDDIIDDDGNLEDYVMVDVEELKN